jgi:hypothetical protein
MVKLGRRDSVVGFGPRGLKMELILPLRNFEVLELQDVTPEVGTVGRFLDDLSINLLYWGFSGGLGTVSDWIEPEPIKL